MSCKKVHATRTFMHWRDPDDLCLFFVIPSSVRLAPVTPAAAAADCCCCVHLYSSNPSINHDPSEREREARGAARMLSHRTVGRGGGFSLGDPSPVPLKIRPQEHP